MPTKRKLSTLIVVAFLLTITVGQAYANTGTWDFDTSWNCASGNIGWNGHIYGDSFAWAVGTDNHCSFTQWSIGAAINPSWTFGVVAQNGNANISKIQTNYIRFIGATTPTKTLNLTFYYTTLPAAVDIGQPTNTTILAAAYFTNYAAWVAAPSPAVYKDAVNGFLMVKSTNAAPVIQFDLSASPPPPPPPTSQNNNIIGILLILMVILILIALGFWKEPVLWLVAGALSFYEAVSIANNGPVIISTFCDPIGGTCIDKTMDFNVFLILFGILAVLSFGLYALEASGNLK